MAKKTKPAAEVAAVEPVEQVEEAGKPGELSASEVAAVLRGFHWSDDTSKEKAAAALVERFSVLPRLPKEPAEEPAAE